MSLYSKYRDISENGIGKYTIVAYRESNEDVFRGYVEARYDSELRCIECITNDDIEKALVELEKENLGRQRGQNEWVVRIYSGTDLTHIFESDSEEPDREVLSVDFAAIEARAKEEHEETQRTLMAVRIMKAHELAEEAAAKKEAEERSELRRLQEKYGNA